jgi:hypothetical protein
MQLVMLAGQGLGDKQTANLLGISPKTVVTLWSKIRSKLGTASRIPVVAELAAMITRIACRFDPPAWGVEKTTSTFGHVDGFRVLLSPKYVILSCGMQAEAELGTKPGLMLADATAGLIEIGGGPAPVGLADFAQTWSGFPQLVKLAASGPEYAVSRSLWNDPILGELTLLEFTRV